MKHKKRHLRRRRPGSDGLDELLSRAAWPEPAPRALGRLEGYWVRLRRRGRLVGWWPAAAAVFLAAGASFWWASSLRRVAPPAEPPTARAPKRQRPAQPEPISRPATLRERLAIMPLVRQAERERAIAEAADIDEWLNAAIENLAAEPDRDAAEVAESLPAAGKSGLIEHRLMALAGAERGERRAAAVRLLAAIASRRSLLALVGLLDDPAARDAAAPAVARLAGPHLLAGLARQIRDPDVRRQLLAGLCQRRSAEAVELYLDQVADPQTAPAALEAIGQVPDPPAELLLAYLDHRESRLRWAAARSLGRVEQPEVIRRLIVMAAPGVRGRTALAALLSSNDERAERFVALAREDPAWAASIRSAQVQLKYWGPKQPGEESSHDLQDYNRPDSVFDCGAGV